MTGILIFLLLGGAGTAAYFLLKPKAEAAPETTPETPAKEVVPGVPPAIKPIVAIPVGFYRATAGGVNIRAEPNVKSKSLKTTSRRQIFYITESKADAQGNYWGRATPVVGVRAIYDPSKEMLIFDKPLGWIRGDFLERLATTWNPKQKTHEIPA